MTDKIQDDSESGLFEIIKEDYFNNNLNQKKLAEKYNVNYGKLLSIARSENWKRERENLNSKVKINGGSKAVESETSPDVNSNGCEKGGNSFLQAQAEPESVRTIQSEMDSLRSNAFELASSAADALVSKDDWNPKEFDLLVGTFAKLVGVQMKMEGSEDGLDRLFSDVTEAEVFRAPSAKSEEGTDES